MKVKNKYRALRGFEYPKSLAIRNRIRKGEEIPLDERGETQNVLPGKMVTPPEDLLGSWLRRGLVEEVEDGDEG